MAASASPAEAHPGWFTVPAPVRNLFERFPLQVYASEPLPIRAPAPARTRPALYVFVASEDALDGRPSYNPSCLKWQVRTHRSGLAHTAGLDCSHLPAQTLLRIAGVDVDVVSSNNHASPSGALPFLLPPSTTTPPSKASSVALTGNKIYTYARQHATNEIPDLSSPRLEAYKTLLTQNVRPAWVCCPRSLLPLPSHN